MMIYGAGRLQAGKPKVQGRKSKVESQQLDFGLWTFDFGLFYLTLTATFFVPQGDLKTTEKAPVRLLTEVIE
jgi:hypothetical protein